MERYLLSPGPLFFCTWSSRLGSFLLSFSFIALSMTHTYGQYNEEDFVKYTVKEGLSDNSITCIEKDHRGFIWIGTEFGLNRYDGYQFENYYQGNPAGFLTSSNINKFSALPDNRLAIITKNGMQVMNTVDFSIRQFVIPDTTPFKVRLNHFMDAMELSDGTIGAATATGFYVFDSTGLLIYRHDAFGINDVGNKRILYGRKMLTLADDKEFVYLQEDSQAVYDIRSKTFRIVDASEATFRHLSQPPFYGWRGASQISDHEYFFLTRQDSMIYYDHRTGRRLAFRLPSSFDNKLTWESNVFKLDDTTFLINGGYHGFYRFHFNRMTGVINYDRICHLDKFKIRCFYVDRSGRLWIGTSSGLLKQKQSPLFPVIYHWPVEDISRYGYSDAFRYEDKLYVSRFSRDVGMVMIDMATMQKEKEFSFFSKDNAWNEVFYMEMYHPDTLWLGTNAGLMWFDIHSNHYGKVGELISGGGDAEWATITPPQRDGSVWMCDLLGGNTARYFIPSRHFEIYDHLSNPPLPFLEVKHVCIDTFGDTWIGGHSLARFNRKTNEFDTLMKYYGGPNRYEDDIKLLRADDQGALWLHNVGNGLLQYKIQSKEWVHYGMKDGLPSDVIQSMSDVRDNTLWLTCLDQLIRFDTKTRAMETYNAADGIPEVKPVAPNMYVDPTTDNLYVFYQDDVVILPFDYHQDTTWGSDVLFQEINVNSKNSFFFPEAKLALATNENNLAIHFTVVDFHDGQQTKFAFRMNAKDDWTDLGNQRMLNLTNVAPGDYTLEIAATSKSGVKKTNTLSFTIAPPFWTTSWFIIAGIVMISAIVYLIYRIRISQIQQKANLDKLLSQTEMKALHAQMNPHFVFNSLNSIREMILNNETHQASRFLGNFAHLIRLTLDQSRQTFISLRSTMDYLNRYIEMEKIRNPDFHFAMIVDKALEPDDTILPPLLIQPFIENAIWHGLDGEDHEIHISVQFKKQGDQLVCTIEDDGIGIDHSLKKKNGRNTGHASVSIANIQKRIELLNRKHNLHSSVVVQDKNGHEGYTGSGTIVSIILPLEINEE